MRQRPFTFALALALALGGLLLFNSDVARGDTILTKNNGLGAASIGTVGLTLGALALAPPPSWEGYPKDLGDRPFIGDATAGRHDGCAVNDANMIAKALLAPQKPSLAQTAPLHVTEIDPETTPKAFDEKAIYDRGTTSICPQPAP